MQPFIIPLNGLAQGRSEFRVSADSEFFGSFENSEILDAGVQVAVSVEKAGRYVGVDCRLEGTVTVECDRCLGRLVLPVERTVLLSVKFGQESSEETGMTESGREIVFLPEADTDLDLSQIVYDYVCLSLPMLRVHPEGGCDPETVKYLSSETEGSPAPQTENSPFAALKDILGK